MSNYRTQYQDLRSIEQQMLKTANRWMLYSAGKFDIHAHGTRRMLPVDPRFAHPLGITAHSGGLLGEYQGGLMRLDQLERTWDVKAALTCHPALAVSCSQHSEATPTRRGYTAWNRQRITSLKKGSSSSWKQARSMALLAAWPSRT